MEPHYRITLRAVEPADADFMFDVENDPDAWKYGDNIAPISRKLLRDYAMGYDADPFSARQLRLIVCDCRNGKQLGIADIYDISAIHHRGFAGIYILREFRKQGYAEEALNALSDYARNVLNLHKIWAHIEDGNIASEKLFIKCGFSKEASVSQWTCRADTYHDLLIFSKTFA